MSKDQLKAGTTEQALRPGGSNRRHRVSQAPTCAACWSSPVPSSVNLVLSLACPASPPPFNALTLAAQKKARRVLASTSEVYGDPLVHPGAFREAVDRHGKRRADQVHLLRSGHGARHTRHGLERTAGPVNIGNPEEVTIRDIALSPGGAVVDRLRGKASRWLSVSAASRAGRPGFFPEWPWRQRRRGPGAIRRSSRCKSPPGAAAHSCAAGPGHSRTPRESAACTPR